MWSSSSTPSSSAPLKTSSRCTPAANDGCFSFLRTDFGSRPSSPVGRTSPHACTKPESSSHAKSVFFSGVSRGSARCSACESTVSIELLGVALLAEDRRAVLRMLVERGVDLVVEVVEQRGARQNSSSSPNFRAYAPVDASTASACRSSDSLFVYRQRLPGAFAVGVHGRLSSPLVTTSPRR